jgi:hypothetical protein
MADHTTYLANVGKYAPGVDDDAVKGIVSHLGIALQGNDSSLVACADKSERDRVRDSFLKKKLGLTDSDADLDAAVQAVCQEMGDETNKSRVTFYYLLAKKYDKLSSLH